jgi:hypothetical protein
MKQERYASPHFKQLDIRLLSPDIFEEWKETE